MSEFTKKSRRINHRIENKIEMNRCYTYFKIVGNFDPDDISAILNLTPEKSWKIGDLRRNGTKYDFALWDIGRCTEYDVEVKNQMRKTIDILKGKIPLLNHIRQEYEVSFFLVVVPPVYADETSPCLAPSRDIIDFCHATRTEIDIDLYVNDSKNE